MGLFSGIRSMLSPTVIYVGERSEGVVIDDITTAELYRTQPNLRSVVGFLADNAAMIPWKTYARVSDDDRRRVRGSTAALLLARPNPSTTSFEFKRSVYADMLLYGRCVVLVLRDAESASGWQLLRIPPTWVRGYHGRSPFAPESIDLIVDPRQGRAVEVPSDSFILFHGYDPSDPMRQSGPVSSLKETLYEQVESAGFRRQMWKRGGRFNAYVTRPVQVDPLDDQSFARLKEGFANSWAGKDAAEGGSMPILEDGMEIKTVQFNARDAQWMEAKRLGREDVAGVYHVNPALIWPGSGQTYASARDNARALYNDTLATLMTEVVDRINAFLLPMVGEEPTHYVEYDLAVKTQGSFEEQASVLQSAVGGPWLTRNEARARQNLPAKEGGDDLITPLNVIAGGLASPNDTDPNRPRLNAGPSQVKASALRKSRAHPDDAASEEMRECFSTFFARQKKSVMPKLAAKAGDEWWDEERWDRELSDDLFALGLAQSTAAAKKALAALGIPDGSYSEERTRAFVRKMCETRAGAVNAATKRKLDAALAPDYDGDMTPESVFDAAEGARADEAGRSIATAVAGWAALEGIRQCAPPGGSVTKTWIVTSGNPRATHAAMHGETVGHDDPFSNGAMWPGDTGALPVDEVAGCQCEVELTYSGF